MEKNHSQFLILPWQHHPRCPLPLIPIHNTCLTSHLCCTPNLKIPAYGAKKAKASRPSPLAILRVSRSICYPKWTKIYLPNLRLMLQLLPPNLQWRQVWLRRTPPITQPLPTVSQILPLRGRRSSLRFRACPSRVLRHQNHSRKVYNLFRYLVTFLVKA